MQEENIWKQALLAIAVVVVLAAIEITAVQTLSFEQIGKGIMYVLVLGLGICISLVFSGFYKEL